MIKATITRDKIGNISGFTVTNHGDSLVCAAVSMLVLNTVNSLEAFAEDDFHCDYNEEGGFLAFALKNPATGSCCAQTLLNALALGLSSTNEQYAGSIKIRNIIS